MNRRTVLILFSIPYFGGLLLISACGKKQPDSATSLLAAAAPPSVPAPALPPVEKVPPAPDKLRAEPESAALEDSEKDALQQQVRDLQAQLGELNLKLESERLAALQAALEREKESLAAEKAAWEKEREKMDAEAAAQAKSNRSSAQSGEISLTEKFSASPGADFGVFYESLASYGVWFEAGDYGWVWQPEVAVSDSAWRPYTCGSWVWCDDAWTWVSDEPFGWAVYHYGRWALLKGRGWIWVPGDRWAPAWVCWRKSDTHIGWCPLPPETVYDYDVTYDASIDITCGISPAVYVFVSAANFCRPVRRHCEPAAVCLTLVRSSVNITRLCISSRKIECGGPRYDWVRSCLGSDPPRYSLQCLAQRPKADHHDYRPRLNQGSLCVYAPRVAAPWNLALRPGRTAAPQANIDPVRADAGIPPQRAQQFQQLRRKWVADSTEATKAGRAQRIVQQENRLAALQTELQQRQARAAAAPSVSAPPVAQQTPPQDRKSTGNAGGSKPPASVEVRPAIPRPQAGQSEVQKPLTQSDVAPPPAANVAGEKPAPIPPPAPQEPVKPSVREMQTRPVRPGPSAADVLAERLEEQRLAAEQQRREAEQQQAALQEERRRLEESRRQTIAAERKAENDRKAAAAQRAVQEQEAREEAVARQRAAQEQEQRNEQTQRESAARAKEEDEARRAAIVRQREAQEQQRQHEVAQRESALRLKKEQDAREEALARQREAMEEQRRELARREAAQRAKQEQDAREAAQQRQRDAQEMQRRQEEAQREAAQRAKAEQDAREQAIARQREAQEQQRRHEQAQREAAQRAKAEQDAREQAIARQREAQEQQRRQEEAQREAAQRAKQEQQARENAERMRQGNDKRK